MKGSEQKQREKTGTDKEERKKDRKEKKIRFKKKKEKKQKDTEKEREKGDGREEKEGRQRDKEDGQRRKRQTETREGQMYSCNCLLSLARSLQSPSVWTLGFLPRVILSNSFHQTDKCPVLQTSSSIFFFFFFSFLHPFSFILSLSPGSLSFSLVLSCSLLLWFCSRRARDLPARDAPIGSAALLSGKASWEITPSCCESRAR